jgi:hypothetical protein
MVDLPESIGRYRVDGVVGSGGFATVYRAYDERFDAIVAVKVLAENHCLDPDVRERFLKEGRVLRRVGSPHLVTAHDLGENAGASPTSSSTSPIGARSPSGCGPAGPTPAAADRRRRGERGGGHRRRPRRPRPRDAHLTAR